MYGAATRGQEGGKTQSSLNLSRYLSVGIVTKHSADCSWWELTQLTCSLPQNALAPCEDFLLFAVVFEATMIDPSLAKQPISLEISIGVWPR